MTIHDSAEIRPFRIAVPQADLDDLAERLARTPLAWRAARDRLEPRGAGGLSQGAGGLLARDGFDWRAQEARLNQFPQYATTIDGQTIHFAYVRSPEPGALPLLITTATPARSPSSCGSSGR